MIEILHHPVSVYMYYTTRIPRLLAYEVYIAEGPSTQYLRLLAPLPYQLWLLGPESLNVGHLDPLGHRPHMVV